MKDTLRQPDGKIRTACKFCRQRKKRCSGEMPCASCINFNRDCCVYDRYVPSSSSTRSKEVSVAAAASSASAAAPSVNRSYSWADHHHHGNNNTTKPTSPCFTSKVLLTKVNQPLKLLQAPFIPQAASSPSIYSSLDLHASFLTGTSPDNNSTFLTSTSNSTSWSPFDSPLSLQSTPLTPSEAMIRTISLPNFIDRSWTQDDHSPILEASPLSFSSSMQSSPLSIEEATSIQSSPSSRSESQSSQLSTLSFSTPTNEIQSFRQLLYQGDKETQELLQDVDALLMHIGGS